MLAFGLLGSSFGQKILILGKQQPSCPGCALQELIVGKPFRMVLLSPEDIHATPSEPASDGGRHMDIHIKSKAHGAQVFFTSWRRACSERSSV